MVDPVFAAAQALANALRQHRRRIVFAESCTAGLVSATLARIPGISEWHCGSAVVYRLDTKHRWLGIPEVMLQNFGAVSREVAVAMATGVLNRTPEADLAGAITGHLGPDAPAGQDGLIWMAVAPRGDRVLTASFRLPDRPDFGLTVREARQRSAAQCLLEVAAREVERAGEK